MTTLHGTPKQLVQTKTSDIGPQIIFISPANLGGVIISAVNIANSTSVQQTYSAWLAPTTSTDVSIMIPATIIKPGRTDSAPELIGQVIPPGWAIWVQNESGELVFTLSGRQLD